MRLPGLDLLRSLAIVWVMLFHAFVVGGVGDYLGGTERFGWMGVDLFFVLSGYLIGTQVLRPMAAGQPLRLGQFYARRAWRILPAFFVVLGLYVAWPAWREVPGMQPLWQFPTFTFNLLFDEPSNVAFSHAWSLCVEEHFYLLFPLAALLLARRPNLRRFALVCALLVVGGMVLRTWLWSHFYLPAREANDGSWGLMFLRYIYYPTYARLDGLVAGVALAACGVYRPAWMAWLQRHGHPVLAVGVTLLGVSLVVFTERTGFAASVFGYPLLSLALMVIVAAASGGTSWLARVRVPGAGWIAAISYSLYLSHKGVMHLMEGWMGHTWYGPLQFALYALATLAGGAALYYVVERPFLQWRDARRVINTTRAASEVA